MYIKHLHVVKNPQNVEILKINDLNSKTIRKIMKFFKVFDEKKTELTFESILFHQYVVMSS
jgi:hypothetical protein